MANMAMELHIRPVLFVTAEYMYVDVNESSFK